MTELFLIFLNRSIAASWLVLVVALLRILLQKAPRWITLLLWAMVAFRLLCPVTIDNPWSLIPSPETVSPELQIQSGIPVINHTLNPVFEWISGPAPETRTTPLQVIFLILSILWAVGAVAQLGYAVYSYIRLRGQLQEAVRHENNVFFSEQVKSPFVFGLWKPRIYLPYNMPNEEMDYVIRHEQAHIKRLDHWWKLLGYLTRCVYWINPVIWWGYHLFSRDVELSCDEKVYQTFSYYQRAAYTDVLVHCSIPSRAAAVCPLAMGEPEFCKRVDAALAYRRPGWILKLLALVVCGFVAFFFVTDSPAGYGMGVRSIRVVDPEPDDPCSVVLELDYLIMQESDKFLELNNEVNWPAPESGPSGYYGWVEHKEELGEKPLMICFPKTEASDSFKNMYQPGQVYELHHPTYGTFKFLVEYPPEYALAIYVGTEYQIEICKEYMFNKVRTWGGTMRIRLWLGEKVA